MTIRIKTAKLGDDWCIIPALVIIWDAKRKSLAIDLAFLNYSLITQISNK